MSLRKMSKAIPLVLAIFLFGLPALAQAQERVPLVAIYELPNLEGKRVPIYKPGEYDLKDLARLGLQADEINGVEISQPGCMVTLYDRDNLRGAKVVVLQSTPTLAHLNNHATSFVVSCKETKMAAQSYRGRYTLKSAETGKYCSVTGVPGSGNPLSCKHSVVDKLATFLVEAVPGSNDTLTLRGSAGKGWFCADENNQVWCNRSEVREWEGFEVHRLDSGKVALKGHNPLGGGRKFCGVGGRKKKVVCDQDIITKPATFVLERVGLHG